MGHIMNRISIWGKICGIGSIILGGMSVIISLMASSFSGLITGVVTAFLGYLLYKAGTEASRYLETSSEDAIEYLLENFAKYLLISGILLIFSIITTVFSLFVILQGVGSYY
ncbi:hypothetical protein HXA35_18165 [Bacillus sp. A301a_S52]|nr:hypothetical protein [Bacillus sp. A301a_S52]